MTDIPGNLASPNPQPIAPDAQPTAPDAQPTAPDALPTAPEEHSIAPEEQRVAPHVQPVTPQLQPIVPRGRDIPSKELPTVPAPPPMPLPDILVDPFIDDVSQGERAASRSVVPAGALARVPVNALRSGAATNKPRLPATSSEEPKRLSDSQKGRQPAEPAKPKATRIVFKSTASGNGGR